MGYGCGKQHFVRMSENEEMGVGKGKIEKREQRLKLEKRKEGGY
jgi:hypothetical protein